MTQMFNHVQKDISLVNQKGKVAVRFIKNSIVTIFMIKRKNGTFDYYFGSHNYNANPSLSRYLI